MYNSYEEYMREVLGYPYNRQEPYENTYNRMVPTNNVNNEELEKCYPEIYRIVRPMVTSTCQMYSNQTITEEVLEEMTMKIFMSVETNENRGGEEQKPLKNGDVVNPNVKRENREDRNRPNNFLLKDLIKILLINELIGGRPNRPPHRPPMPPPPPPRPPQGPGGFYPQFGTGGTGQGMRPPMRPF